MEGILFRKSRQNMIMTELTTLAAGILAAVGAGAGAVLCAAPLGEGPRRRWLFTVGSYGVNIGGLVLMIGSVAGWQGADAMFCGLLMVVFGTGTQCAPANKPSAAPASETVQ
jgi:hypothetical protein